MSTSTLVDDATRPAIDPTDPHFYDDPFEAYAWLHAHAPVYKCDVRPRFPRPFWIVSTWPDIRTVGTDSAVFHTRDGVHLTEGLMLGGAGSDDVPGDPRLALGMKGISVYDGPEHVRIRGAVNGSFRPKPVARLEPMIRRIVTDCLDAAKTDEIINFIDIAHRVPLLTITELLGLDIERAEDFERWSKVIIASFEPDGAADWDSIIEMFDFLEAEMDARRAEPRDDLITQFLTAEHGGRLLSNEEILMWCWILLAGGLETTEYLLGGGLRALLEHPQEKAKLVEDPSLIRSGVAEMLRWTTPVRYMARTAAADTVIGGMAIEKGDQVMINYTIANFDPAAYEDPFTFSVERSQNEALTFGIGPHHCIGSGVARLEGRVMFEELLRRFPNVELAGAPEYYPSTIVNAIVNLPVILNP